MSRYVLRRLVLLLPTLVLVTLLVFSIIRLLPGDIVTLMMSEQGYATDKAKLEQMLGLDRPFYEQYVTYVGKVLQGDLGVSFWTKEPVLEEILRRLPVSLELAVLAMFFGLMLALPAGIFSAIRQDTWLDYLFRSGAVGGLSIPGFWMATVVIVSASIWWHWVPPMRYTPLARDPVKNLAQLLLPAIILGLALSASVMRMTRSMVLEVLREDYVRTAWAKGLTETRVVARHVLKNAMIPVVTVVGLQLSTLIGGTVIMESIFVLPGMGKFLLDAITWRDYPVIQGINLFLATGVIVLNLVIDLVYGYLDPRIRFG
ncbi:MAG TPA: ABC transporter permease [Candidatus Methylomirabilis sp.]|nr:ABC transporter permease [Candidatus Methylomirabilis sp.]